MTDKEGAEGSWYEYRRQVMGELERIGASIANVHKKLDERDSTLSARINKNEIDIAMLQVKASMWGALSGSLAGAIAAVGSAMLMFARH